MSAPEDATVVVRGRWPPLLAGILTILSFVLPLLFFCWVLGAERDPNLLPWVDPGLIRAVSGAILRLADRVGPPILLVAMFGVALAISLGVARFFERRMGDVELSAEQIVWNLRRGPPHVLAREWRALEGFRDTPHPWVEVLERDGRVRTIPTPTEADRARVLELLAKRLVDLALPFEERRPPAQ